MVSPNHKVLKRKSAYSYGHVVMVTTANLCALSVVETRMVNEESMVGRASWDAIKFQSEAGNIPRVDDVEAICNYCHVYSGR